MRDFSLIHLLVLVLVIIAVFLLITKGLAIGGIVGIVAIILGALLLLGIIGGPRGPVV